MPSRGLVAAQALTRTTASPERTTTAPSACLAIRPVSMEIVRPPTEMSRVCIVTVFRNELRQLPGARVTLLADAEALDQIAVAIRVLALQIVKKAAALADEFEQP